MLYTIKFCLLRTQEFHETLAKIGIKRIKVRQIRDELVSINSVGESRWFTATSSKPFTLIAVRHAPNTTNSDEDGKQRVYIANLTRVQGKGGMTDFCHFSHEVWARDLDKGLMPQRTDDWK